MGILGEYAKEDLLPLLQEQAAAYEAVDPSRPVKLAYEVIASVAQRDAGADGNYLEYTDSAWVQEYVDYTAANDLLLILDMQYGRNSTEQEIDAVEEYLLYPHVHLALDPEFHVADGEVPGEDLGQIDASDVNYALRPPGAALGRQRPASQDPDHPPVQSLFDRQQGPDRRRSTVFSSCWKSTAGAIPA